MAIISGKRKKTKKLKSELKGKRKTLFVKKIIKRIKGPKHINSIMTNNTPNNLIDYIDNNVSQDKIEVSYILGILNAERTLRECLSSIFIQDFPKEKFEVIIVDGGSQDKTLNIVNEFMKRYNNIRLFHNPHKLSEGRGMSKDIGVEAAKGEILIFLDHDNILLGKEWPNQILEPFEMDKEIMASQSLLQYKENDTNFLKYVNSIGVEDPFAIPYSLPAQIILHPKKFKIFDGKYYLHQLHKDNILYGGANGCAFRKEVFKIIGGYTRDVDVFASMSEHGMKVAVPLKARVYHKTTSNMFSYMKKKGAYFYRFIDHEYEKKSFKWTQRGSGISGKIKFFLMIANNLSLIGHFFEAIKLIKKTGKLFWLLHPFYVFFITIEYGLITSFRLKNFLRYQRK
ncbi:MAG: glycosyltransferase [Nanoarchaeota archaeon]